MLVLRRHGRAMTRRERSLCACARSATALRGLRRELRRRSEGAHPLVVLLLLSSSETIAHVSPSTAEVYPRACGGGR